MHLKVHSIKNPDIYNREYQKYLEEEYYEKPIPEVVKLDYSIADFLIIGYKVYINTENDNREIGIYTTLETMDFMVVDYEREVVEELEDIIQVNNQYFREGK